MYNMDDDNTSISNDEEGYSAHLTR